MNATAYSLLVSIIHLLYELSNLKFWMVQLATIRTRYETSGNDQGGVMIIGKMGRSTLTAEAWFVGDGKKKILINFKGILPYKVRIRVGLSLY